MSDHRVVVLPRCHTGQRRILQSSARFKVVACGRRWGKTTVGVVECARWALQGGTVGWFAPTFRMAAEPWRVLRRHLLPASTRVSETDRRMEFFNGGSIEIGSLDNPDAGRGRKFRHIVIDEAAAVRELEIAWYEVLRPTLTDEAGTATLYSTPKGRGAFFGLWQRGESDPEWARFSAPSHENPYLPSGEVEAARGEMPERVFRQEYLAEFGMEEGAVFANVRTAVDAGRVANETYQPAHEYRAGVDLGRARDWTVVAVIRADGKQVAVDRFRGLGWSAIADRVARTLREYQAWAWVDSTGVGDPVVDMLRQRGAAVRPFVFTANSKTRLIEGLAARLERGELNLMDRTEQTEELEGFAYRTRPGGHLRLEGPPGGHDDCVCALALAVYGDRGAAWVA
ncbi:MAG: terminase family protein [Fimbriimonadaceae bacterium]|nr:terminase family protein [Fimbriimonadaceae bacterium]